MMVKFVSTPLQFLLELRELSKKPKKEKATSKKLSIENLLEKIDIKELRAFVSQFATKNKDFATNLYLHFADKDERIDIEQKYKELISKIVKENTDRNGFSDYYKSSKLGKQIAKLIANNGVQAIAQQNYKDALVLGKVVLAEITDLLENSDDSNGEIGDAICDTINLLNDLALAPDLSIDFRDEIFNYLSAKVKEKIYFDYGDYGSYILDALANIAPKLGNPDRFLEVLDALTSIFRARSSDFYLKELTKLKIDFLEKTGRKTKADELLEENINLPEIRQKFVDKAIQEKNLEKAKVLIKQGVFEAEKLSHAGTIRQWEEQLFSIAQTENDKIWIEHYAKKFYENNRNNSNKYYNIWKNCYTPQDWTHEIERYINKIILEEQNKTKEKKVSSWYLQSDFTFHRLLPIFFAEGFYERLLHLLQQYPTLGNIQNVHEELKTQFPAELMALYEPILVKWASQLNGTDECVKFCNLLKKIKKDLVGSDQMVLEIVQKTKKMYSKRPSLQKELNKV